MYNGGDGREQAALDYVKANAKRGDPKSVLGVMDRFGWDSSFLMNVGNVKGKILDGALDRAARKKVGMELGAYVGYSAVRIASQMPEDGHLYSIEFFEPNAKIARQILEFAGLSDKVTVVNGSI